MICTRGGHVQPARRKLDAVEKAAARTAAEMLARDGLRAKG